MKIFFIGAVQFSKSMLDTLIKINGIQVVGIATKKKSNFNSDHFDLSTIAISNKIPFKYIKDINSQKTINWISKLKPDIIYCFGWSSLIKSKLLGLCPKGVVGYHPAELPKNRGRHPIIWALSLGLKSTASTFFKMDEGADSGDIISQKKIAITNHMYANDLYNLLEKSAKRQLNYFTNSYLNNNLNMIKQDHNKSNYWRKRSNHDGKINFTSNSLTIYNLIRALHYPYVGAHIEYLGNEIKVWKSEIGPEMNENIEPGKVIDIKDNSFLVKTMDSSIWITDHEFQKNPDINTYLI